MTQPTSQRNQHGRCPATYSLLKSTFPNPRRNRTTVGLLPFPGGRIWVQPLRCGRSVGSFDAKQLMMKLHKDQRSRPRQVKADHPLPECRDRFQSSQTGSSRPRQSRPPCELFFVSASVLQRVVWLDNHCSYINTLLNCGPSFKIFMTTGRRASPSGQCAVVEASTVWRTSKPSNSGCPR